MARPSPPLPCLCLVTDRTLADGAELVSRVVRAVECGVDLVQLREKDLPGGQLLDLAQAVKDAVGGRALMVVNERVDVAAAVGSGVQLGEEGLPIPVARRILGPDALIGKSVHTLEGAMEAASGGADFLIVGSMYATRSHPEAQPAGPELVRDIARQCFLPLIGIGGINAGNAGPVLRAGAGGVAVITGILAAPDPGEAAAELKRAMLAEWESLGAVRHSKDREPG